MNAYQQQLAELQERIAERDEIIQQLRMEADGAAEAVQAAQAARAEQAAQIEQAEQAAQAARQAAAAAQAAAANVGQELNPIQNVLKSLQTPQILRDLPSFDGSPVKLHSFLRSIDNLIPIINSVRGTPMHTIWIQAIRTKIVGDADNVLELYGTNLDWDEIKSNLITHYSDRRDEISLTRDLFGITQIGSVEDFYSKISHIVSLLINLLNINEANPQVKTAKNLFYQQMGLKVFLSGLKDPLGPIIRAQAPSSMKEALRLCLEEKNYHYAKSVKPQPPPVPFKPFSQPPPVPNRNPFAQRLNPFQQFLPRPQQSNQFNPFQQYTPRPQQSNQFKPFPFKPTPNPFNIPRNQNPFQNPHNPFVNRNAFAPKPNVQPRPTPMDVDPSVRSRNINYMNRPHYQLEEEYACYYPQDPSLPLYDEHSDPVTDVVTEQQQPDQIYADTAEATTSEPSAVTQDETDDLNFQAVARLLPLT